MPPPSARHSRRALLGVGGARLCRPSGNRSTVENLAARIGSPELVICLDSGCLDDERLWVTTSLRGLAEGELTVEVLTAGKHSGGASGIVPSSFRLIRQLLDRLEDSATGRVLLPELHVEIPVDRSEGAAETAAADAACPRQTVTSCGLMYCIVS